MENVEGTITHFRDLLVWQKSITLAKEVYAQTGAFPAEERFGLTSQIRRAAVSISSNIAEGHARQGREFAHFLSISYGSLAEVESQLLLSVELGYLSRADLDDARAVISELRRMLTVLRSKIVARQHAQNSDP
jgi:four helix bundle protein